MRPSLRASILSLLFLPSLAFAGDLLPLQGTLDILGTPYAGHVNPETRSVELRSETVSCEGTYGTPASTPPAGILHCGSPDGAPFLFPDGVAPGKTLVVVLPSGRDYEFTLGEALTL